MDLAPGLSTPGRNGAWGAPMSDAASDRAVLHARRLLAEWGRVAQAFRDPLHLLEIDGPADQRAKPAKADSRNPSDSPFAQKTPPVAFHPEVAYRSARGISEYRAGRSHSILR